MALGVAVGVTVRVAVGEQVGVLVTVAVDVGVLVGVGDIPVCAGASTARVATDVTPECATGVGVGIVERANESTDCVAQPDRITCASSARIASPASELASGLLLIVRRLFSVCRGHTQFVGRYLRIVQSPLSVKAVESSGIGGWSRGRHQKS